MIDASITPSPIAVPATPQQSNAIEHFTTIITMLALIATVVLYFLQRNDALDLQRKQNTMAMLQIRYSDKIYDSKVVVGNYIKSQSDTYQQTFEAQQRGEQLKVNVPDDVLNGFLTLTEFFDSIAVCRVQKSCDQMMVDQLFKEDMCSFGGNVALIGLPQLTPVYGKDLGKTLLIYIRSECPKR